MINDRLAQEVSELQNVSQFIADSLEKMIMDGQLEPGEHLVQTEIAAKFGVSRLPVRDALKILEKRDLAVNLPRKGVIVRPVTVSEIKDLYELRLVLEGYVFTVSLPRLTEDDIHEAESIIKEQESIEKEDDFQRLLAIDERFHRIFWSKCQNKEFERIMVGLWNRIRVIRTFDRVTPNWRNVSASNHRKIIQAVREKDSEKARKFLEIAIIRARDEIIMNVEARERKS